MTRPLKRVRASGRTERQKQACALLWGGQEPIRPADVAMLYQRPSEALQRLARRGYLVRVGRGRYRVAKLGEAVKR